MLTLSECRDLSVFEILKRSAESAGLFFISIFDFTFWKLRFNISSVSSAWTYGLDFSPGFTLQNWMDMIKKTKKSAKVSRSGKMAELADVSSGVEYRKTVLPNGLRILSEKQPAGRAVSCGIWIDKGTRHERHHEAGMAHFVEHMLFKRTEKRSAYQIARDMEAVGGELNAFTSRESTCFVTHALTEDLGLSLDVLSDLVCRPVFDSSDIRKEKSVVLQEIHMSDDVIEDSIFDRFFELAYAGSTLGTPILGSVKSVGSFDKAKVVDFHQRHYRPENMIVTVAGRVEHDDVLALVLKHLKFKKPKLSAASLSKSRALKEALHAKTVAAEPHVQTFRRVIRKPSEQAHVVMGLPAANFTDRLRFEAYIVNTLLGGGMTSRLFQSVREDKGLAYSVYSQLSTFIDSGVMLIYAGTEPKKMPTLVETMLKELRRLKKHGVSKGELSLFKTQVLGQILLGADDVENRMNSLGANEMVMGRYRSVENVMQEIEAVSLDSLHEYLENYMDLERAGFLVMGPVPEEPTQRWLRGL